MAPPSSPVRDRGPATARSTPLIMTNSEHAWSKTIHVAVSLSYEVSAPTTLLMSVAAAGTSYQHVDNEHIDLGGLQYQLVHYGQDGHRLLRVTTGPAEFTLHYAATVTVARQPTPRDDLPEIGFDALPSEALPFVSPSRFCESDRVVELSTRLFGDLSPGYQRVQAISEWVRDNLTYVPGSTDATSTATDVLVGRAGVCRDFAHVAICMCRGLGIPARYVSGYGPSVDPPDFHGVMEAFVGGEWFLFDPTGMSTDGGLVRIATGRDAADVAFATFVGQATLQSKKVDVTERDTPSTSS
jgi:transglutaminase-like putative cysteine protease